jgi:hypothetical protein
MYIFPLEDGHTTETYSGFLNKILNNHSNNVALDGNPEPEPDMMIKLSFFLLPTQGGYRVKELL